MSRKNKPEGKKYSYMDTYGDLVTLLLCFFVLLFSMSTVEENKYNAFVEGLNDRFGANPPNLTTAPVPPSPNSDSGSGDSDPTGDNTMNPDQSLPADLTQLNEAINKYIDENNLQGQVDVQQGNSGANYIRLNGTLLFDGESHQLRPQALKLLGFLGECFTDLDEQIFQVRFNGHTASIPGSRTDDWVLSGQRSSAVASFFVNTVGFSPYKVFPTMNGRFYPIADNNNYAEMSKNRRVDVVVIGNNPEKLLQALAEASQIYFPDDDTQFFEGSIDELPSYYLGNINPAGMADQLDMLTEQERKWLIQYLEEMDAPSKVPPAATSIPYEASTSEPIDVSSSG